MGPWRAATKAQVGVFEVCLVIGTNLLAFYPLCTFALHDLVIPSRICVIYSGVVKQELLCQKCQMICSELKSSESFIMETTDGIQQNLKYSLFFTVANQNSDLRY